MLGREIRVGHKMRTSIIRVRSAFVLSLTREQALISAGEREKVTAERPELLGDFRQCMAVKLFA